jgi:hypothetical protein
MNLQLDLKNILLENIMMTLLKMLTTLKTQYYQFKNIAYGNILKFCQLEKVSSKLFSC